MRNSYAKLNVTGLLDKALLLLLFLLRIAVIMLLLLCKIFMLSVSASVELESTVISSAETSVSEWPLIFAARRSSYLALQKMTLHAGFLVFPMVFL